MPVAIEVILPLPETDTVTWDRAKLERLKAATKQSKLNCQPQFIFEGHQYVPAYAQYLIQWLEQELPS